LQKAKQRNTADLSEHNKMDKDNTKLTLLMDRLNTIYQTPNLKWTDKRNRINKQNIIRHHGCRRRGKNRRADKTITE